MKMNIVTLLEYSPITGAVYGVKEITVDAELIDTFDKNEKYKTIKQTKISNAVQFNPNMKRR